jgi:hypothetical protein
MVEMLPALPIPWVRSTLQFFKLKKIRDGRATIWRMHESHLHYPHNPLSYMCSAAIAFHDSVREGIMGWGGATCVTVTAGTNPRFNFKFKKTEMTGRQYGGCTSRSSTIPTIPFAYTRAWLTPKPDASLKTTLPLSSSCGPSNGSSRSSAAPSRSTKSMSEAI